MRVKKEKTKDREEQEKHPENNEQNGSKYILTLK